MLRAVKVLSAGLSVGLVCVGSGLYLSFWRSNKDPTTWSGACVTACQIPSQRLSPTLTQTQHDHFEEDGYLIVKNVFPKEYIQCVGSYAKEYVERYEGVQKWFSRFSKRRAIHAPAQQAGFARNLTKNLNPVGKICSDLMKTGSDDPLRVVLDTLDVIPNGQSSAKSAPYRRENLRLKQGIRAWVPFQHISNDTAPTVLVPKSHTWTSECQTGHYENQQLPTCPNFADLMREKDYWNTKVVGDMEPGDVLFINTRVLHGWGPNLTPDTRLAMRLTIKPAAAKFYQPINFSATARRDLTQPQIWPPTTHSDEGWPIKELGFTAWATLSLNILRRSLLEKFQSKNEVDFRPVPVGVVGEDN